MTAAMVDVGSPRPRVLRRESSPIETQGGADVILGSITETLLRVGDDATGWMIALPGPFDYERGTGTFDGVAKFGALAGLDLRGRLGAMLGVPAARLRFVNDAVAYAIGEWSVAPTRPDRFVCITLGTGVGSAFLERGRPVTAGEEVPPHGWAHLLEIDGAPLEDSVSTRAIQRRYAQDGGPALSVRDIADRARHGEALANTVLDRAMFELGEALAPWIASFAATETVVGGSMARSWDVLHAAFERGVLTAADSVQVTASRLLDDAPLIGAAVSI